MGTFTYTGDPANVPLDAFRITAGDTSTTDQLLQDDECRYYMTLEPDNRMGAARALDDLASKFARKATFSVGQVSKQLSDVAKMFEQRAKDLRLQAGKMALPFFGGQSNAAKEAMLQTTDVPQPRFTSNQFDNPLAEQMDENAPPIPFVPGT